MEPDDLAAEDVLRDFVKDFEGGTTKRDITIDGDNDVLPLKIESDSEADDPLDMKVYANQNPLDPARLALHLPKCKGCPGCDEAKTVKSNSRRR